MSRKHPWMAMKDAMVEYRQRLLAAGQPDHRNDDGGAVDPKHDERGDLERRGNVEGDLGEVNRNQKHQSDREDNREAIEGWLEAALEVGIDPL